MSKDTIINWIAFGSGAIAIQAMLYRLYSRANFKQITKEKELRNARFEQRKKEYEEKKDQLLKERYMLQDSYYMGEQKKMIVDNPARFNR